MLSINYLNRWDQLNRFRPTFLKASLVNTLLIGQLVFGWQFLNAEEDRNAYFGELHVHTVWSFDAFTFGTRATPDDAYEFGKGRPLKHPLGEAVQLRRPLDFMSVTDHAFYLGVMAKMTDKNHPLYDHPLGPKMRSTDPEELATAFTDIIRASREGNPIEGLENPQILRDTWTEIMDSANRHYEPGKFTTFIGYEWTSTPDGQNLHRNVIFRGDTAPTPFSRLDSLKPEDLWAWMDSIRRQGHQVLAIPHNSNISDGRMFEQEDSWGNPFTAQYAETRVRNEPLVEVTQIKGTSETHPMLSPNDEFAHFEPVEQRVASKIPITQFKGGYVRDALKTGLEFQDKQGFNPYQFGMLAATDSHTGIVTIEEDNYSGKVGTRDGTPHKRLVAESITMDLSRFSASGLAGIWAEENTRESLFDAMQRKETWGTSGPRIQVRMFGGYGMQDVDLSKKDWVDTAYNSGVSMGSELEQSEIAPTFVVWALKDPDGANLDRIQIVKGWSSGGNSHEHVYDVAWSGDRTADSETGKVPAVGSTVDLDTASYTNTIGAVQLKGTWTDPTFNPEQNAFYYTRVLEIPTPRWSLFDAIALGIDHPSHLDATLQERAYTSPIWYQPRESRRTQSNR